MTIVAVSQDGVLECFEDGARGTGWDGGLSLQVELLRGLCASFEHSSSHGAVQRQGRRLRHTSKLCIVPPQRGVAGPHHHKTRAYFSYGSAHFAAVSAQPASRNTTTDFAAMNGSCACGAVTFVTPTPTPMSVYHCHCIDCRKQSSSAFGTSAIFP